MKASNQKIVDQDEVTVVSVNKSLLSVDYASTLTRPLDAFTLIPTIQRTSRSPTTSKKAKPDLKSPRSVFFCNHLVSLLIPYLICAEEEAS